jgi:hypothetical protein
MDVWFGKRTIQKYSIVQISPTTRRTDAEFLFTINSILWTNSSETDEFYSISKRITTRTLSSSFDNEKLIKPTKEMKGLFKFMRARKII